MKKDMEDHALMLGILGSAVVALGAYLLLPPKAAPAVTSAISPTVEEVPVSAPSVSIPTDQGTGSSSTAVPSFSPASSSQASQPDWAALLAGVDQPTTINLGSANLPALSMPALAQTNPGDCRSCGNTDPLKNYAPGQAPAASTPVQASGLYAKILGQSGSSVIPGLSMPDHNIPDPTGGSLSLGQLLG